MKKIFTLFAGLLMAAAVFAADHRPTVMLNNNSRFKVVIDGRSYFGDDIRIDLNMNSYYGSRIHTVKVYEIRRGFFTRERLVDAKTFVLGRNDLKIRVDRFGQVDIREMRNGRGFGNGWKGDDRGWNGNEYGGQDNHDGRDNRDVYDNRDGRGRGF